MLCTKGEEGVQRSRKVGEEGHELVYRRQVEVGGVVRLLGGWK